MSYHYTLYGLHVLSSLACPELCECAPARADVTVSEGAIPVAQDQPQDRVAVWGTSEDFRIYVPGIATYQVLTGSEIVFDPAPGIDAATLRLFLLGSAFGALLHQRGMVPIHGSAVATPAGALIFSGPQGHGKSTLAAAFAGRGYPLLGDDVCALTLDRGQVWLHPAYPRLNLLPDAVERLLPHVSQKGSAHPITGKHAVTVTSFRTEPIPVRALYELHPAPVESIHLRELHGYDRLTALMGNTYRVHFLRGMGKESHHFAALQQIARRVRVVRVERPDSDYRLDELVAAIYADESEWNAELAGFRNDDQITR